MGKRYGQLGIEERTMIQTQLEMGIKPAAIGEDASARAGRAPPAGGTATPGAVVFTFWLRYSSALSYK